MAKHGTSAQPDAEPYLTVAVSSSALFDLARSDKVFREQGPDAYRNYQIAHENEVLPPGRGFAFVRKLLEINERLRARRVDVILLSRNSPDTGLRVFNSIDKHGLDVVRAAFTSGKSPYCYAEAFGCDLFLSADAEDVAGAIASGTAAATLLMAGAAAAPDGGPAPTSAAGTAETLKIAFDGDAVLFDGDAERVYHERGLDAFSAAEKAAADTPMGGGPFKPFLEGLHRLQREFDGKACPIRTALVTARGAPAHKRVINTLRTWDIRLDESLFLGGLDKAAFLRAYEADMFFDDQRPNCDAAKSHVATGHVPHGADSSGAIGGNDAKSP